MREVVCFYAEAIEKVQVSLRRYVGSVDQCTKSGIGYHNAHSAPIFEADIVYGCSEEGFRYLDNPWQGTIPHDDPRWPTCCACGRPFTDQDTWQVWVEQIYRRTDTGELVTLHEKRPGMMWDAWWMPERYRGPDGRCLMVILPNGHEWMIDGRASNCTKPDDWQHRCWVRHGDPPHLTVDKNGVTCQAGAGSILAGDYHGFLRNGRLVPC
jgi:hypothetical protein